MLGWPGTEWDEEMPDETPPIVADWTTLNAEVRHTFTHFHLRLTLRTATVANKVQPNKGEFQPLNPRALPTVMRKAYDLASKQVLTA